MAVNVDIFGSDWVNYANTDVVKLAHFDTNPYWSGNYADAITVGMMEAQALIDESIYFSKIGDKSALHKLNIFTLDNDGNLLSDTKVIDDLPHFLSGSNAAYAAHTAALYGTIYGDLNRARGQLTWRNTIGAYPGNNQTYESEELQLSPVVSLKFDKFITYPILFCVDIKSDNTFNCTTEYLKNNLSLHEQGVNVMGIGVGYTYTDNQNVLQTFNYGNGSPLSIFTNTRDIQSDLLNSEIQYNRMSGAGKSSILILDYVNNSIAERTIQIMGFIYGGIRGALEKQIFDEVNAGGRRGVVLFGDIDVTQCEVRNNYLLYFTGTEITSQSQVNDFIDFTYKQLSLLGYSFIYDHYIPFGETISRTANYYAVPYYANGYTTDEFSTGSENTDNPAYSWNDIHDNNIVEKFSEKDKGDFLSRFGGADVEGAAAYGLSKRDMIAFINWINSVNTEGVQQDFKGKNPVDYIITCMYSPYQLFPSSSSHNLTIAGNTALYPSSDPLSPGAAISAGQTRDMFIKEKVASFFISRVYNDFRDFAPYTTIELSIPFCDTVQLDPAVFYNHHLNVTMSFDTRTGNCMAHICRDDYEIQTISGTFAVPVTFSAIAQGSYQNSMKQNQVNFANSVINTLNNATGAAVNAAMSVNAAGAVASGMNLAATIATGVNDIEYNMYKLTHTAPSVSRVGNIGDLNNFSGEIRVKLLIKHFKALEFDSDSYQTTTGYACSKAGKIGSYSGFIKCSSVKLADNNVLTANEKTELKNLLCKGVII